MTPRCSAEVLDHDPFNFSRVIRSDSPESMIQLLFLVLACISCVGDF